MPNETITIREILKAEIGLPRLTGFKKPEPAKKITRVLSWVTAQADEYRKTRKLLVDGHAEKDKDGNNVSDQIRVDETGEWRDIPDSFKPQNLAAWEAAERALLEMEVNMSGEKIRDEDIYPPARKEVPDPSWIVALGPLYEHAPLKDEEEGEDE